MIDPATLPEEKQRMRFFVAKIMTMRDRSERREYLEGKVPDKFREQVRTVVVSNFEIAKCLKRWRAMQ